MLYTLHAPHYTCSTRYLIYTLHALHPPTHTQNKTPPYIIPSPAITAPGAATAATASNATPAAASLRQRLLSAWRAPGR